MLLLVSALISWKFVYLNVLRTWPIIVCCLVFKFVYIVWDNKKKTFFATKPNYFTKMNSIHFVIILLIASYASLKLRIDRIHFRRFDLVYVTRSKHSIWNLWSFTWTFGGWFYFSFEHFFSRVFCFWQFQFLCRL